MSWRKSPGDEVEADEPVCDIASDKVDTEVVSPADGVIARILVNEGQTVAVGATLAEVAVGSPGLKPPVAAVVASERAEPPARSDESASPGAMGRAGAPIDGAHTLLSSQGRPGLAERAAAGRGEHGGFDPRSAAAAALAARPHSGSGRLVSPVARRLATEHGIDLADVIGSGTGGRVRKSDVLAAISATRRASRGAPAALDNPMAITSAVTSGLALPAGYDGVPYESIPTSRIRRMIAEHMTRSLQGAAHVTASGLGQEGVQAGAVSALRRDDYLFYAHRGLGAPLAKGMSPVALFGDLFGRVGGSVGGKGGGTVHVVDPGIGVLGQGGTLGSNFVLGAGAAMSARMLANDRVVAIFFGDGAASRGTFHEAALPVAKWKLPVLWICENNGWAMATPIEEQSPTVNIADRALAYGVPGVVVDGQDAVAVRKATLDGVTRARAGEGPTLIEAKTLRYRGHYEGDQQKYRQVLEDGLGGPRDPLTILRQRVSVELADRLDHEAGLEMEEALEETLLMPRAGAEIVIQDVWA